MFVHSRHRSINNFIMNLVSALGAYCFYDNKPHALSGFEVSIGEPYYCTLFLSETAPFCNYNIPNSRSIECCTTDT